MESPHGVLEAARSIRPYLAELVGPVAAPPLDARLADALAGMPRDPVAASEAVERLREALFADPATRSFTEALLEDSPRFRPVYVRPSKGSRGGDGPPPSAAGDVGPIEAERFDCPQGNDYTWYREQVGSPVPECPTHSVPVEPEEGRR
ncbi:hypothetical protein [Streptomyces seoulensis]|uniref:hypothetical protein n=1 Tax=Streptomyces seoulensis TaxID=73044 RepID=UPI001FCB4D97|nr:hypothetical protein [Streptomyces seoulensis]BDH05551.1 hypothetical protein HEK131_27780 [Streptomyces seoulensis]